MNFDPAVLGALSVGFVSLISLIGVFVLSINKKFLQTSIFILISLAAGALLGDAFVHLIPESFTESSEPLLVSLAVLMGIFIFFILEKYLRWHHCHGEMASEQESEHVHPIGALVIISDALHNIIDGLAIGVAYYVSPAAGVASTVAVILHEIPQEIADFGMLIHAGFSRTKALLLNFASALTAFFGLFLATTVLSSLENIIPYLAAFAAGNFIYIALADLVPELHKETRAYHTSIQLAMVGVGILLMILLLSVG